MFFYGRVDDPAIETVELSLRYISGYGRGGEKNRFEEAVLLTVPEESWIERNGRRYFLLSYWRTGPTKAASRPSPSAGTPPER